MERAAQAALGRAVEYQRAEFCVAQHGVGKVRVDGWRVEAGAISEQRAGSGTGHESPHSDSGYRSDGSSHKRKQESNNTHVEITPDLKASPSRSATVSSPLHAAPRPVSPSSSAPPAMPASPASSSFSSIYFSISDHRPIPPSYTSQDLGSYEHGRYDYSRSPAPREMFHGKREFGVDTYAEKRHREQAERHSLRQSIGYRRNAIDANAYQNHFSSSVPVSAAGPPGGHALISTRQDSHNGSTPSASTSPRHQQQQQQQYLPSSTPHNACRHFSSTGSCPYGWKCKFAHVTTAEGGGGWPNSIHAGPVSDGGVDLSRWH